MEKEYDKDREESIALSKKFAELEGRRPRIYVPEMDDDGCGEKRRTSPGRLVPIKRLSANQ